MKYNRMTRRMFLQGSGSSMLAIPFLSSLLPRETWGQTSAAPKRFIALHTGLDYGHHAAWIPGGAANPQSIPQPNRTLAVGNGQPAIRWQPLREFAATNSSSLGRLYGTSLSPYLEYINIMRGLDFCDLRPHDPGKVLGGSRPHGLNPEFGANWKHIPTIDSVLNASRKVNPAGLPHVFGGTLEGSDNSWSYSMRSGNTVNLNIPISTLEGVYNAIFRSGSFPETGSSAPAHPRRALLNTVIEDFRRVMNSRNISSMDRQALSNAMDKFSDIHNNLSAGTTSQCSHRNLPRTLDMSQMANIPANGKALADIISAAVMCDATRIMTFSIADMWVFYTRNPLPNVDLHQNVSHTPYAVHNGNPAWHVMADLQAVYYRNIIGPLLQNLAGAIDPSNGRSYLYNSLVFSSPEAGQTHGTSSHPVILAGNAGGAMTSGNYIDYSDRSKRTMSAEGHSENVGDSNFSNNWVGLPYNRLMVTILQAMGLAPADYEDDTLNSHIKNATDLGTQNNNLTSIGGYGYVSSADFRNNNSWAAGHTKWLCQFYDFRYYRDKLPMP